MPNNNGTIEIKDVTGTLEICNGSKTVCGNESNSEIFPSIFVK
jgi:hypothetical protein